MDILHANYSRICVGTWRLGGMHFGPYDQRHAHELLDYCGEVGISCFDTAQFYAKGQSNKVLAPHLKQYQRSELCVSSKGGLKWVGNSVIHDASHSHLKHDLYETLDALGLDYLDYYFLHWPDANVNMESVSDSLIEFKTHGLIRNWGLCNVDPQIITTDMLNEGLSSVQIKYNALDYDESALTKFSEMGLEICSYSPLEQGILCDRFDPSTLSKSDWRLRNPHLSSKESNALIHHLKAQASSRNLSLEEYSIKWVVSECRINKIITGPKTIDQLKVVLNYFCS